MSNNHYRVTMVEAGRDGKERTIVQEAYAPNRRAVIDFYGLNEADIISYRIEELGD